MSLNEQNIVIQPNVGVANTNPKITFTGADASTNAKNIVLNVYPTSNGTLSFEGNTGQLFSISDSMSGTIFSVNDISGIPSIEVLDTGLIKLAQYSGNVAIGKSTANSKLDVYGGIRLSSTGGFVEFNANSTNSGNIIYTLPNVIGGNSYALLANTDGKLYWSATVSSSNVTVVDNTTLNGNRNIVFTANTNGQNFSNVEISSSKLTFNPSIGKLTASALGIDNNVDIGGNVVISGNVSVLGTTTTLNVDTLTIEDKNVVLANVASPTDVTADGAGLTVLGATNKTWNWVDSTDSWTSSENINLASGKTYKINGTDVLTGTTLGSGVTTSSLTSVGTLASLNVSGQIISTDTWDAITNGGNILLNSATGNRIDWNMNGAAAPSTTTRSVGTKLVLYPGVSASQTDYAIGIESNTLWNSVAASTNQFKWYANTTNIMTLSGTGVLTANGSGLTSLTAGNLTGTIPSSILGNSTLYLGTTAILLNRTSAAQSLTGITSIDGSASTLSNTRTLWGQNFNGSGNVTGSLISVGNITGTSTLGLYSTTTSSVTLDSGSTGSINIGTNANAKTITIGNQTGATSIIANTGTNGVIFNQVAAGIFKVQASAAPTTDMVQITNSGQAITTAGVNSLEVTFVGGAAAVEAGAIRTGFTPGTTTGGTWNGYRIVPTAAAASGVTMNGMKFDNITAGAGTDNMIYAGTGWDNIINYNGISVINGTGQINASQLLVGTIPGDRGVTAGSTTASFIEYNGTTKTAGQFDGGSTAPSNSTRLNYDGNFYANTFYGVGTGLTGTATGLTANVATYEVINNATTGTYYPQLVSATSGTLAGYANNGLSFNIATGTLSATSFSGNGTNLTGISIGNMVYNANVTGSVNVTVGDKLREYISVKDFGAKGDGIANDTSAVQNTINYALSTASNNKCVYFPSGSYLISSVTVGPTISMKGDGKRNSVILCNTNNSSLFKYNLLTGNSASPQISYGFNFTDLYINSNSKTGCRGFEITGANAYFSRCSHINIKDVDFTGSFKEAIFFSNTANIVLKDIHASGSNSAIYLYNPADCDITNVKTQLGSNYGIVVDGDYPRVSPCEGMRITSCSSNGQKGGLSLRNHSWGSAVGCSWTTTTPNTSIGWAAPLVMDNCGNWKFDSCEFAAANTTAGVAVSGINLANTSCEGISFNGCNIILNYFGAFLNGKCISFNGCFFNAQGGNHIYSNSVKGLSITGCQFENYSGWGSYDVFLSDTTDGATIMGNTFRTVYTPGGTNVIRSTPTANNRIIGNIMAGTYSGFTEPRTDASSNNILNFLNRTNIGTI